MRNISCTCTCSCKPSQIKYTIPHRRNERKVSTKKELTTKVNVETKDGRKATLTSLVDSGCTYTCIGKKLVAKEKIKTKKLAKPFSVVNADGMPNEAK